MAVSMAKICFVVTVPFAAKHFLMPYLKVLAKSNEVFLVSNFDDLEAARKDFAGITLVHVPISRKIALRSDLTALTALYRFFRRGRFDIVHSYTPKAGLLGMAASRLAGVPLRFHTFTGQVWATRTGMFRLLLKALDRVIFQCAAGVLIDSPSQRDFLIREGVVTTKRSRILGHGSFCGVDCDKFKPDPRVRIDIRSKYGIPEDAFVFLFIGRLNREKGIGELVDAFKRIAGEHSDARLVVVGPDEEKIIDDLRQHPLYETNKIICESYTPSPEHFMAAADVFCLPSHREGFGGVIIESAAVGIPAIGSNIYGITDAIVDGETGVLHQKGDVQGIYQALKSMISRRDSVERLGTAARNRALAYFSEELLVREFQDYYQSARSGKAPANAAPSFETTLVPVGDSDEARL